jgi:hypothetical protein
MKTKAEFQQLMESLSQILGSVPDIDTANTTVLATLARSFECQWAAYWKVDAGDRMLHAVETWCDDSTALQRLLRDTETRALSLSEGTPGHVWYSGRPVCTNDLIRDMSLPRSLLAKEAGCVSGIWFPIRANQRTYGVIELLGKHPWPNNQQFLDHVATLGDFIGRILPE